MTTLRRALADFIRTRRALGFTLRREAKLLDDFVAELDKARRVYVTTATAIAWATQPRDASASWWISRLVAVRGFAKYLQTLDPRNEIPPLELLPARKGHSAPYVYSPADITALLAATDTLSRPLLMSTYRTLLGLLATTGMRVGEAVGLDDTDVDRRRGVIVIRKAKFGKSREVPVHVSTVRALERYVRDRGQLAPHRKTSSFFVSTAGSRLFYNNVHATFLRLVYAAGLGSHRPRPTIHDLRHTFAIRTVLEWYRDGVDVEARLPLLSTYLGHVGPSSTYWYLTAVPELLEAATVRLERSQVMP